MLLPFHIVHEVLKARILKWLAIPFSSGPHLSDLSTMTRPSWVAPQALLSFMASGPITSWEIDREIVETVSDFIFLGSKITADGDCSHEIKNNFLPYSLEGKL